MPTALPVSLMKLQEQVEEAAHSYGLTFFKTCYELLNYDEINMVASYMGFPVRYPHWKWGMEYEKLSKGHEYGIHKIYEMVINNDPCYAYLQESNAFIDQKIVMCHVTGHNDFFKNNFAFQHTNRKMMDQMANHASRVRQYIDLYGVEVVENFIDRILSLDNLIDYQAPYITREKVAEKKDNSTEEDLVEEVTRIPSHKEYMDSYINPQHFIDEQKESLKKKAKKRERFPKEPAFDVLNFMMLFAPLKRWQRDIIDMLREEAYYFAPQGMTKIMNEGWASYWHTKLMTDKLMTSSEVIDFADRHSAVVAMTPGQLNPYKLGLELYRDIEERWDKGQFGSDYDRCDEMAERRRWDKKLGLGQEKIFQVRKIYNDVTFIDEFFTLDFCKRMGFYAYGRDKKTGEYLVESRDFVLIKNKLLSSLSRLGQPSIAVVDGNFENRAELLLEHFHDGIDLDFSYGRETMRNLFAVWNRPVHLLTSYDEKRVMLTFDGENFKEKLLGRQI